MSASCIACRKAPATTGQGWCSRCAIGHALTVHSRAYVVEQIAPEHGLTARDVAKIAPSCLLHTLVQS